MNVAPMPAEIVKQLETVAELTYDNMIPAAEAINLILGHNGQEAGGNSGDGGALLDGLEHAGLLEVFAIPAWKGEGGC